MDFYKEIFAFQFSSEHFDNLELCIFALLSRMCKINHISF